MVPVKIVKWIKPENSEPHRALAISLPFQWDPAQLEKFIEEGSNQNIDEIARVNDITALIIFRGKPGTIDVVSVCFQYC